MKKVIVLVSVLLFIVGCSQQLQLVKDSNSYKEYYTINTLLVEDGYAFMSDHTVIDFKDKIKTYFETTYPVFVVDSLEWKVEKGILYIGVIKRRYTITDNGYITWYSFNTIKERVR